MTSVAILPRELLPCPQCHRHHVDGGEFANRPHHTHRCAGCGYEWDVGHRSFGVSPATIAVGNGTDVVIEGREKLPTADEEFMKQVNGLTHESLGYGDVRAAFINAHQNALAAVRVRVIDELREPLNHPPSVTKSLHETASEMLICATAWEPDARLIGNVRAGDIREVCRAYLATVANTTATATTDKMQPLLDAAKRHAEAMGVLRKAERGELAPHEFPAASKEMRESADALALITDAFIATQR